MFPLSATLLFLNLIIPSTLAHSLPRGYRNRAAYFQDNDPSGASIIAVKISEEDGCLLSPVKTPTGGKGFAGLIAVSQGSVVVERDYLFTVNSGDNTLSMFKINPEDSLHPKLIGTPAPTSGDLPVSVAYSAALKIACVANAGPNAGISCFSADYEKGLTPTGAFRSVPHPTDNGNPGAPPFILIADIVFNPSSTAIFATARSNGAAPGHIYAWPVVDGKVAEKAVVSTIEGVTLDFSLNFLGSDSRLLLTDPVPGTAGAAYLNVEYPSLKITQEKSITIPGQFAACWAAYAPRFQSVYVIDAGKPNITILNSETGDITGGFSYSAPAGGPSGGQDSAVDRKWLYVLTDAHFPTPPAPKINVFDLEGGNRGEVPRLVQSFDIFSEVGPLGDWTGLAIYPS